MTKLEYIKQLEQALKGKIPENDIYDIMRDYAEYFEEGKKQNKTEDEIARGLGIPYAVAAQILGEEFPSEEEPGSTPQKNKFFGARPLKLPKPPKPPKPPVQPSKPMDTRWIWAIVLILLSPVILFVAIGILSMMVGATAISIGGLALICCASMMAVSLPITAVFTGIFGGITMTAAGVTFFCLLIMLIKFIWRKLKELFSKKHPPVYTASGSIPSHGPASYTPPVYPTPPAAPQQPAQTAMPAPTVEADAAVKDNTPDMDLDTTMAEIAQWPDYKEEADRADASQTNESAQPGEEEKPHA